MKGTLKTCGFLIAFLLFFLLLDYGMSLWGESAAFPATNDFEITRREHPEEVWDKVFFGNSAVISAYREDVSESGYVNLGMDYAVVTDLWDILRQGHIEVGSDLVIGLNVFTLLDDFDTNPGYIWHRGLLEPYSYFHRDKLRQGLTEQAAALLGRESQTAPLRSKIVYHGSLSDGELQEKMAGYNETYFCRTRDDCQENIDALISIANWCEERGVRLRLIWMPYNPSVERPDLMSQQWGPIADWAAARDIDVLDCSDAFDESCFHDVGHLNYEYGAYVFTREVDQWLLN